jgi:gliding motility-associated-like protein
LFVTEQTAAGCLSDEVPFRLRVDSTTIALDYISFSEATDSVVDLYVRTTSGRLNANFPVALQRADTANNWQTVKSFGLGFTGLITDELGGKSGKGLRYRLASTNGCGVLTTSAIHNTIWLIGRVSGNDAVFAWSDYAQLRARLQIADLLRRKDDERNLVPYAVSFSPAPLTYKIINNGPDGFNQQFRLNVTGAGVNVYSNKVDLYYENPLQVYNVWTPNGDNVNDAFTIENLALYANNEVVILNRYGVEVFKATNYRNDFKGDNLAAGTYFFRVTAGGKPINGWVEVLK